MWDRNIVTGYNAWENGWESSTYYILYTSLLSSLTI